MSYYVDKADGGDRYQAGTGSAIQGCMGFLNLLAKTFNNSCVKFAPRYYRGSSGGGGGRSDHTWIKEQGWRNLYSQTWAPLLD